MTEWHFIAQMLHYQPSIDWIWLKNVKRNVKHKTIIILVYCAFDIFQRVVFCLALYSEENLQTFVLILCKTICRNYLGTKSFILVLVIGFLKKKSNIFTFCP